MRIKTKKALMLNIIKKLKYYFGSTDHTTQRDAAGCLHAAVLESPAGLVG